MIVVVEGIDRSGKSTVCEFLGITYGLDVFKDRTFEETYSIKSLDWATFAAGGLMADMYLLEVVHDSVNIVMDRFHLTELVYSTVERGGCRSEEMIWNVDRRLAAIGAKLLMMHDVDVAALYERAGKDLSDHDAMMRKAFEQSAMDKLYYTLSDPISKVTEWLLDYGEFTVTNRLLDK